MAISAQTDFRQLVGQQEMSIKVFDGYGRDYIKTAGFSPDAFVQMAIQLGTYRLFGQQVATYESSQVRSFLHGRTETTRSVSLASHDFVKKMAEPEKNKEYPTVCQEKISLLRAATWSHSKYLNNASKALGCDRHFFGLSMVVGEDEVAPALFQHPVFNRSKHWRVSSSSLRHLPGFGCVVDDGVGIGYNVGPDYIEFTVSGRSERQWTKALGRLLEEALLEMKTLNDMDQCTKQ